MKQNLQPVIQAKIQRNLTAKKIVLFGFPEYYKEPESVLYNRINETFRDILGVDLVGYIEATYRIGKYNDNKNRPLVIELLSKRMAKYITENSKYFQGTQISISDFLDENARKTRRYMREEMLKARRKGLHAVIRNNQLYIEGKNTNLRNEHNNTHRHTLLNRTNDREQLNLQQETPNINNNHHRRHSYNYNNSFRNYSTTF